jgi:hypothetical protein
VSVLRECCAAHSSPVVLPTVIRIAEHLQVIQVLAMMVLTNVMQDPALLNLTALSFPNPLVLTLVSAYALAPLDFQIAPRCQFKNQDALSVKERSPCAPGKYCVVVRAPTRTSKGSAQIPFAPMLRTQSLRSLALDSSPFELASCLSAASSSTSIRA